MNKVLTIVIVLANILLVNISISGELTNFKSSLVKFNLPQGWTLGEVAGITKTSNGHFIVFHRGEHQLLEFDQEHNFVRELGQGLFKNPHGLRLDRQENIWVTDSDRHLVLRFSPEGEITMVLGKNNLAGTGWFDRDYNLVLFNNPLDVAFDNSDNIYVVDKGNARIVKMDKNGAFIKAWGKKGNGKGEFNFAHSIVIDKQNRVIIADRENKRIQLFDLEGKVVGQWDNLGYPYVIQLNDNHLWVTDARAEKVRKLNLQGEILDTFQGEAGRNPGQFSSVHGIHVDVDGTILVSQIFNWAGINQLTSHH